MSARLLFTGDSALAVIYFIRPTGNISDRDKPNRILQKSFLYGYKSACIFYRYVSFLCITFCMGMQICSSVFSDLSVMVKSSGLKCHVESVAVKVIIPVAKNRSRIY